MSTDFMTRRQAQLAADARATAAPAPGAVASVLASVQAARDALAVGAMELLTTPPRPRPAKRARKRDAAPSKGRAGKKPQKAVQRPPAATEPTPAPSPPLPQRAPRPEFEGQCQGTNAKGRRCRFPAAPGGFCATHDRA